MRVFCTRELLRKIKAPPSNAESIVQNNGWYAKVFRHQRKQYIAALELNTLVTVVFPGKGITAIDNFGKALRQSILHLFDRRGWKKLLAQQVSFDSARILIEKVSNRRLLGSLNEMTRLAHYEFENSDSLDIAIDRINEAPMSLTHSAPEWILDKMTKKMGPKLEQ
jgi:hypothetical protein